MYRRYLGGGNLQLGVVLASAALCRLLSLCDPPYLSMGVAADRAFVCVKRHYRLPFAAGVNRLLPPLVGRFAVSLPFGGLFGGFAAVFIASYLDPWFFCVCTSCLGTAWLLAFVAVA